MLIDTTLWCFAIHNVIIFIDATVGSRAYSVLKNPVNILKNIDFFNIDSSIHGSSILRNI